MAVADVALQEFGSFRAQVYISVSGVGFQIRNDFASLHLSAHLDDPAVCRDVHVDVQCQDFADAHPSRRANGDESRSDSTGSFSLPFDTGDVWGKAKVPVTVTINGYTWRSTVGNRGGVQYIVVNAAARRGAGVKAGDFVTIALEPDSEKREIEIPLPLQRALGKKLCQKLDALSFTRKKEFIAWYSEAKKDDTRARRVEKMKQMLSAGKVIS